MDMDAYRFFSKDKLEGFSRVNSVAFHGSVQVVSRIDSTAFHGWIQMVLKARIQLVLKGSDQRSFKDGFGWFFRTDSGFSS